MEEKKEGKKGNHEKIIKRKEGKIRISWRKRRKRSEKKILVERGKRELSGEEKKKIWKRKERRERERKLKLLEEIMEEGENGRGVTRNFE